jgi:hydrogenase-4 component E
MEQLLIFLLLIVFLQTRIMNLKNVIICLMLQSTIIAGACLMVGMDGNGGWHSFLPTILTIIFKVWVIPYALFTVVKKLTNEQEIDSGINVNYSTAAAAFFVVLAYMLIDKMLPGMGSRDILASAMVLIMTGLTLIVMRSRAIMQIIGLITVENGIYLFGMAITEGLPIIIELGIFLDVLIAVVILVILTKRLSLSFMTTDTNVLSKLKG